MVPFILSLMLLSPQFLPWGNVVPVAEPPEPSLVFALKPNEDAIISQERNERLDYMLSITNNTSKTCNSDIKFDRKSNVPLNNVTFYPPQTFDIKDSDEKHGIVYSQDKITIKPHKTVKYAFYLEANKSYPGDFTIDYNFTKDSVSSDCGDSNWESVTQKTTVTQFSQDFHIEVDRNADKLASEGRITYRAIVECVARRRGSCNNTLNSEFNEGRKVTIGDVKATVDGQPYNKPVTKGENEFSIPLILTFGQKLILDYEAHL